MTGIYQRSITEIPRFEELISQGSTTEDTQTNILERLETLANQTGQLRVEVQDRPIKYNTQLRDFGDDDYKLAAPVFITIEEYPGEDTVIASFPEVEVFGEGVTEAEAILNLKWAILDLYQELIETSPEELGDLPETWLSVLQQIIQKK
ncbi:MAG: hypothetical protein ABII72_03950 [Parcubacteria group bacterium]